MTDALTTASQMPGSSQTMIRPLQTGRFLPLLAILFVGSGCAALIYEIVWLQMLQLVIGVSALSLGVLLGTFMGGMCVGSLLFPRMVSMNRHPLRVYAMLELAIGVIGLIELKLVPVVADLYTHMAPEGTTSSVMLRAALAGVCLLPPTILMGATLPAIARWVEATPRGVSWLGFFYGTNILGAVTGCLLAGFYLLPKYNMATATMWAAVINASVTGLALLLSLVATYEPQPQETKRPLAMAQPGAWSIYIAIGLSGLTGLGAEVVWTRMLSLMLGATVYTFSLILAVFLLGLGIGSSAGSMISRLLPRPRVALAWCQFLLAVAIAWAAYTITYSIPFWPMDPKVSSPDTPWYMFQADLLRCFWAISPGALLWGASFPLALGALAGRRQDAGRLVGGVYAANTVGAIIGSLAFSMFIIPALGTQGAQRILMVACAISGAVLLLPVLMGMIPARAESEEGPAVGSGSPLLAGLGLATGAACACLLALTVGPPNWVSVAWGRNSAEYMPTQYLAYPLTVEEIGVMRDANSRGLSALHLENGVLTFKDGSGREPDVSDDNRAFVKLHETALTSILRRKEALTGAGTIYGDDERSVPDRYCTFVGEGMNVSVAVTYDNYYDDDSHQGQHPTGYRYFHGAGKVQASSNPDDMRLQRTLGHISALTARTKDGPKDVLVVACGAGVTAGSFVPYGSNITIVDIEPMVPKYVTPQFADMNYHVIPTDVAANKDPLGYAKTKVLIDDGRHFVRTTSKKFDVITSDPIDPWVKGCAALNTVEYYQMCREHLKPGGVMALWIPLYESSNDTAKSVIATFFKVFPNGILWSNDQQGNGYDAVLFGAVPEEGQPEAPLKINIDEMQKYIDDHPAVKQSLRDVNYGMLSVPNTCEAVELLATYAGSAPRMTDWTKNTENLINYDSNLRLQYVAGLSVNQYQQVAIFNGILRNYSFPTEIFSGTPERIAALKQVMADTGREDRQ